MGCTELLDAVHLLKPQNRIRHRIHCHAVLSITATAENPALHCITERGALGSRVETDTTPPGAPVVAHRRRELLCDPRRPPPEHPRACRDGRGSHQRCLLTCLFPSHCEPPEDREHTCPARPEQCFAQRRCCWNQCVRTEHYPFPMPGLLCEARPGGLEANWLTGWVW